MIDSEIKYKVLKNFNKLFVENVHTIRDSDSPKVIAFPETNNVCKFFPDNTNTNSEEYLSGKVIYTPYPNLKITQYNNKTVFDVVDILITDEKPITLNDLLSLFQL